MAFEQAYLNKNSRSAPENPLHLSSFAISYNLMFYSELKNTYIQEEVQWKSNNFRASGPHACVSVAAVLYLQHRSMAFSRSSGASFSWTGIESYSVNTQVEV